MAKNDSSQVGKQSVSFRSPVYIKESASVVGKKEGEGSLGSLFDVVLHDDMNGCDTWEDAESTLQRDSIYNVLQKSEIRMENVRYLFAGDLLGQSIA